MICLKCRNTHAGLKFKQTPIIECPGCGYHEPVSAKYEGFIQAGLNPFEQEAIDDLEKRANALIGTKWW